MFDSDLCTTSDLNLLPSTEDLINILPLLFTPNDFTIIPRLILVPGRMNFEFD